MSAKKMVKIPHLDQASYSQVCKFFETDNFNATEKIDGSNISFGVTTKNGNNIIYIQTKKGEPQTNDEKFIELINRFPSSQLFHSSVIDLLNELQSIETVDKLKYITKIIKMEYGVEVGELQIFSEFVFCKQPNIIEYDVSNTVVLLDVMLNTETESIQLTPFQRDLVFTIVEGLNLTKFTTCRKVDVQTDMSIIYATFQEFKNCYNDDITCRKRNKVALANKAEARERCDNLFKVFKHDILIQIASSTSMLGSDEIEGVVIENVDTKQLMKIVDLDDFGHRRAESWAGTDELKNKRKQLYKTIVGDILSNPDIIVIKEKQEQQILEDITKHSTAEYYINDDLDINILNFLPDIKLALASYINDISNIADNDRTKSAISDEIQSIERFIKRIQNPSNQTKFNLINFLIGPKRINELNTILKQKVA